MSNAGHEIANSAGKYMYEFESANLSVPAHKICLQKFQSATSTQLTVKKTLCTVHVHEQEPAD